MTNTSSGTKEPHHEGVIFQRIVVAVITLGLVGSAAWQIFFHPDTREQLQTIHQERELRSNVELAYFDFDEPMEPRVGSIPGPRVLVAKDGDCWVATEVNNKQSSSEIKRLLVTELGRLMPHPDGLQESDGHLISEGDEVNYAVTIKPERAQGLKVIPKPCQKKYDEWVIVHHSSYRSDLLKEWQKLESK